MRSGTAPGPSRALRGADGALAVFQTKYTLIDEQDIPLVESYSFEVRDPAARAPFASFYRVLGLPSPPGAAPARPPRPPGAGGARALVGASAFSFPCALLQPNSSWKCCACNSPDWGRKKSCKLLKSQRGGFSKQKFWVFIFFPPVR